MSMQIKRPGAYVEQRLNRMRNDPDEGFVKAALAKLRRGAGRQPGEMPELWGFFLQDLPEQWQGQRDPSRAEWAIYGALTLFALHQQGHAGAAEWMHQPGQLLGKALRKLVSALDGDRDSRENRVRQRMNRLAGSMDIADLIIQMRSVVKLLGSNGIGLDYAALADDLYWMQFPEFKNGVKLRWGQDFYSGQNEEAENEKEAENDE
jgi:CRISPR system Cascade subunit CasB